MRTILLTAALSLALVSGCQNADSRREATSLLGEPLLRPELSASASERLEANLAEAKARYDSDPTDEMNAVWYGRRLAYLGRYRDAIDVFSKGIEANPRSYKLRRHRGHRYITVRDFDNAIVDLATAELLMQGFPDESEPDGAPNAAGIPIGTTRTNILYHLGLANYLKGNFDEARRVYQRCWDASQNDDNRVSAGYWLVLCMQRAGSREQIRPVVLSNITRDMNIIENDVYHELLLGFKGDIAEGEVETSGGDGVQNATKAYGIAVWQFINGDADTARRGFERIIHGGSWAAFGYIAAEAELARLR